MPDCLSGILNKKAGEAVAGVACAPMIHWRSVPCSFLNIDGFKGVNDSLGHLPGDVLLRSIGELPGRPFAPRILSVALAGMSLWFS
ncbi:MAG: diguanylate cyclase domain-containing protein [Oscillospiraceae bacterium]